MRRDSLLWSLHLNGYFFELKYVYLLPVHASVCVCVCARARARFFSFSSVLMVQGLDLLFWFVTYFGPQNYSLKKGGFIEKQRIMDWCH